MAYPMVAQAAENLDSTVQEVWKAVDGRGEWCLQLRHITSETQVCELAALLEQIQHHNPTEERTYSFSWAQGSNPRYTVKSGYIWWCQDLQVVQGMDTKTMHMWKWKLPLKVKIFLWMMFQRRLLTKAYRGKWRGAEDQNCLLCNNEVETVEHLFLTCPKAVQLWTWLAHLASIRTNSQDLGERWDAMGNSANQEDKSIKPRMTRVAIPAGLWAIWKTRNNSNDVHYDQAMGVSTSKGEQCGLGRGPTLYRRIKLRD
ncbi:hypothetical protein QJS10_CPB21g01538 [Acorus calamus]|uniref:Reverse transcriptase zinc-binding domain-containing protein n=1 Tax=Acorus calamus TaxID=4465 RepID=A0AAV9C507_ACOCL|nr:hypothetical protein QJS10_CPB21g01538 [Acorus calamus]